ncbi:MAG TPA: beta-ketoacyl synthase chain length factor [Puia sp.]|nr:beta-ketoacyl synthase chain length factor [Puia sp.]
MLYIHHTSCIYPQKGLDSPAGPVNNLLKAVEPAYDGIPGNVLRRMSKSVKMGIGAALPLLKYAPDGILIGTGYGGMEDSIRFLNQIEKYDEGVLTPATFVQSTANAIASQLGLIHHNRGYNITFVNRGLSFESALLDAAMLVKEHPGKTWLVSGVDEISDHHYRFECAEGWYKNGISAGEGDAGEGAAAAGEEAAGEGTAGEGAVGEGAAAAGEGAAAFLLNDQPAGALARISKIVLLGGQDEEALRSALRSILDGLSPDLLLSGENGDNRTLKWYRIAESLMGPDTGIARFKHLCGEYPTASAFALWLACNLPAALPGHLLKRPPAVTPRHILFYNNYKFTQHSLLLLERFPCHARDNK